MSVDDLYDPFGFMMRSFVTALSLTRVLCGRPPTLMGPLDGDREGKGGGESKGMKQPDLAVCECALRREIGVTTHLHSLPPAPSPASDYSPPAKFRSSP